jgi:hypothetical protein
MAKERYRLTRLRDCPDGTRFYFEGVKPGKIYYPYTLVTRTKYDEAVYHVGHQYQRRAHHYRCKLHCRVWMRVEKEAASVG